MQRTSVAPHVRDLITLTMQRGEIINTTELCLRAHTHEESRFNKLDGYKIHNAISNAARSEANTIRAVAIIQKIDGRLHIKRKGAPQLPEKAEANVQQIVDFVKNCNEVALQRDRYKSALKKIFDILAELNI